MTRRREVCARDQHGWCPVVAYRSAGIATQAGLNQVASITQIASGHYRVRIRRKGIQAINMTFPEKEDAQSWANAMEKRIDLCAASSRKQTLEQRIEDSMESTSQLCQAHDEPGEPELIAPDRKLGWIAWDTPDRIAAHPDIKDGVGSDLACFLFITFDNGSARISSTSRPQAMLSDSIDMSAGWGARINGVLVSNRLPGVTRSCDRLCKQLQSAGYRSLGKRIFEGITMKVILRTLRHSYPDMNQPVAPKSVEPEAGTSEVSEMPGSITRVSDRTVASVPGLSIVGTDIRQDNLGRFCLNDLHKASGKENRQRPSLWLANQQTIALVAEVEKAGIPAIQSKQQVGTFVCKELVYAYAMWVSPKFHLVVIRAFDAKMTDHLVEPRADPEIEHAIDERAWRIASAERDRLLSLLGREADEDTWKIAIRIKRRLQDELLTLARSFGYAYSENAMAAIAHWTPASLLNKSHG